MNINKALQQAHHYYKNGNLNRARDIYTKILKLRPNDLNSLHMLETISCQLGNFDEAISYLKKEIKLTPSNAEAYYKIGTVLQAKGLFFEAIEYHKKAIMLKPNFPEAYYNLAVALQNIGNIDEAITNYKIVLQIEPRFIEACNNIGIILSSKGLLDDAINYFMKGLEIDPNHLDIYTNLSLALKDKGNIDDKIINLKKVVDLNPTFVDPYCDLALAFQNKKQYDEAIFYYKKALSIDPNLAGVLNNLGIIHIKKGLIDEAITYFKKATIANPDYADAFCNLGNVLNNKGEKEEAISYYKKAISIDQKHIDSHFNLGNLYMDEGQFDEAISYFKKVLDINPKFVFAYNNLGVSLAAKGQITEAELCFKQFLLMYPGKYYNAHSNLLFTMNYNPRYSPQDIYNEHIAFAKKFEEPLSHNIPIHTNKPEPYRRLKIGYCSPDFRRHPVAYFIEPVLATHDRENFEIFCYTLAPIEDDLTKRIQNYSDHWKSIVDISDDEAAKLIRNDEIDILIDLAGHTGNNRILIFARKPAPIQVNWIGYLTTTGLSTMDYKIVDAYIDPPGKTEQFYSEKLIRLPESFLCYLPDKDSPEVGPLPALSKGYITFGSLNKFSKITPEVITLWSKILKELPDSHLMLKGKSFSDKKTCQYALNMFEERGISPERIILQPWDPSPKHLESYNQIDIALDTFPFNGATTTCEAMWMGVPVITLEGTAYHSRAGVSLLSNVGLPELIAKTQDEYIKIAIDLASNISKLQSLRKSLRDKMSLSPICDAKRFTTNLEMCYRKMWIDWCTNNENK